jgi:hypothetical protein
MEIVVSIAIIAVVSGLGFMAYNPSGQVAAARNRQRELHLQAIMTAIRQNIADAVGGQFSCAAGTIPSSSVRMSTSGYNIAPCLVPVYLPTMPIDPADPRSFYDSVASYDSGYEISRSATSGAITLSAPSAELNKSIVITR